MYNRHRRWSADVETLHLDRGYDSVLTTQRCQALGLTELPRHGVGE